MKKIGLFLLAVMMVAGLAGCNKDHDADPVGTWTMTWDWDCNGSTGTDAMHIYSNGTFNWGGSAGTWSVDGDDIVFNFSTGTVYSGRVDDDIMSGTMVSGGSGRTGCWSAYRINKVP